MDPDASRELKICSVCDEARTSPLDVCVLCHSDVHIDSSCSKSMNIGQDRNRRLCADCMRMDSAQIILGTREEENWRGRGKQPNLRRCKYVKEKQMGFDALVKGKPVLIPIIKNANCMDLQVTQINLYKSQLTNYFLSQIIIHLNSKFMNRFMNF